MPIARSAPEKEAGIVAAVFGERGLLYLSWRSDDAVRATIAVALAA